MTDRFAIRLAARTLLLERTQTFHRTRYAHSREIVVKFVSHRKAEAAKSRKRQLEEVGLASSIADQQYGLPLRKGNRRPWRSKTQASYKETDWTHSIPIEIMSESGWKTVPSSYGWQSQC